MKLTFKAALFSAVSLFALPAMAEQTKLTMYYPISVGGALTSVVDGMIAGFEAENPDIDVTAIYAGNYDDTRVRALSAIKSGEPAQLSVLFSIDAYDLIEQDLILPFDDILKTDADKEWLNGFYPGLMANGQIEGKTWGIPFQRSTIVAFYNKDKFKEAGLDPEKAPATWAEMTEMGKALTKEGQWGAMIPSTGYAYWMFQAFALQNGVELMNADGTKTYFNDPKAIEALEYWVGLSKDEKIMPEGTIEWGTLRQAFVEGQAAYIWHTTGNLTAVKNEAEFDFGVATLPGNAQAGSVTGGGNFYLFKGASEDEQAAAVKLIQYMTAPETAAEWSIATGYMGVSPAAYETEALQKYTADFPPAKVARDQLAASVAEFSTYETARVRQLLENAVQAAITGSKTPTEALTEAQTQADALLKAYR